MLEKLIEIKLAEAFNGDFKSVLAMLLSLFLAAAGPAIIGMICTFVLERIELLRERMNKNAFFKRSKTDDWIFDKLSEVVKFMQVSMVEEIKKASKDGKLTAEEINKISQTAKKHFLSTLSKEDLKELEKHIAGDVETYLDYKIPLVVEKVRHYAKGNEEKKCEEQAKLF